MPTCPKCRFIWTSTLRSGQQNRAFFGIAVKMIGDELGYDKEDMYKILGTKFDYYFFESKTGPVGKRIVENNTDNGIFDRSEGAIIFKGENYGLHTRVFINKEGLPTYEAKELGLAKIKYDKT